MDKVIESVNAFLDELEKSSIIQELTVNKKKIYSNKEVLDLINTANKSDDIKKKEIKLKLYEYDFYRDYMNNYNELMYIVMDINSRMKRLVNSRKCGHK